MVQDDPSWSNMAQKIQEDGKFPRKITMACTSPKRLKMARNDPKKFHLTPNGQKWDKMVKKWPK
jgi:hypothetical protein